MRSRIATTCAVLLTTAAVGGHAFAAEPPRPDTVDLAGSVRALDPVTRDLEPVTRDLVGEVRELRSEERQGERTTVSISSDVLFDFDAADLSPDAEQVVADLAARIADTATTTGVTVIGHTDGIGSEAYNQDLSERRAEAVAQLLRDRLGDGRTITTEGRGFSDPVAPETVDGQDDPAGRARNRRVEIGFDEAETER